jgi:hypothetical protein
MSPAQNQQRLHQQDESPLIEEAETAGPAGAEYEAVRVRVIGSVKTSTGDDQFGTLATIVIPPSAAGAPSYAQVLGRDPLRQYAYLTAIDEPVVLTTALEQAQSASNVVALVPIPDGLYLPAGTTTPPIRHNDPVWAVNTSLTTATRVTVSVERGREP